MVSYLKKSKIQQSLINKTNFIDYNHKFFVFMIFSNMEP